MTVGELTERLLKLPKELPVRLEIQIEAGFYDVRGKYASGRLTGVQQDSKYIELTGS